MKYFYIMISRLFVNSFHIKYIINLQKLFINHFNISYIISSIMF